MAQRVAAPDPTITAGCTVAMPLADMFWGDRYGKVKDPFGHEWSIATKIKDLTPQEMEAAQKEARARHARLVIQCGAPAVAGAPRSDSCKRY